MFLLEVHNPHGPLSSDSDSVLHSVFKIVADSFILY